MSRQKVDAIIMSGGRGARFGQLITKYGCKSLIPILGIPTIEYVLRAVREAIEGRIFLCIERSELIKPISEQINKFNQKGVKIYFNASIRGTMHGVYKLRDRIRTKNVLVLYGHHLIHPNHLNIILDGST
ncbi:MAG: NTP transferase domain-containing protein [Candidatus Staskawiczbacteria bacterium]|nr:NTP transferase domain-containing protein [Candidatus Staskawiczbacteria bacterium]MBI3337070.1 NTP transferase domain-containing protein [Candidatus Staskawiczbacteria bacterium]